MPTLHLHGTPHVRLDGGRELVLAAREAALLAWLHLEGATPRAQLAALLWPAGSDAQARANLRQTLARLRRAAGPLWLETAAGLVLAVAVAADAGQPLLGPMQFDDAEALSRWLDGRRAAQRRDQQRQALVRLQGLLAADRLDEARAASDALLAADPESEEAWRLRMELHYLRGDRAAALAAWDDCRHALRLAYGVSPTEATNALGRLILSSPVTPTGQPGRADGSPTLPTALRRPPLRVGRAALVADIDRCLALGHALVLAGSGGMGKTRLLQDLASAEPGALFVAARPGDGLSPGVFLARLLAQALARFQPDLAPRTQHDLQHLLPGRGALADLPSAQEHRRVLAAAVRLLHACHPQGLRLVLLDDLQYADEASLTDLQVVIGHWTQDPHAVVPVIGLRPDELPPAGQALVDLLVASGRAARFELQPLQQDDLHALLQSLPLPDPPADAGWRLALAGALRARVGGNPGQVLESLKSLWLDGIDRWMPGQELPLPPTLVDSVHRRLQRLGDEALQLARLAAVAGSDFSLALAAAALGRPPLALAPLLALLESAQVFHGPRFAHDLVAEAVQRSTPAALAAALHGLVAAHLASQPQADEAAARIAGHLQSAGDSRAAARWQLRAARQARGRWQMAAAAQAYEAAAQGLDAADRHAVAAAWHEAARCWLEIRRNDEAGRALDAAAALARTQAEQARLLPARTAWLFNVRRMVDAVESAQVLIDAVDCHGPALEPRDLAQGTRSVGLLVAHGVPIDRALALADRVEGLIPPGDDGARRLLRTARGGLLHWAGRPLDALADLQAAWPAADAAHEAGTRAALANQLMRVRHALGDLDGALAQGRALLAESEPLALGVQVSTDVMHVLAMMEIAHGQAAAGMARWAELLGQVQKSGLALPDLFLTSSALACIALGRHDAAAAWLARHPPEGRPGQGMRDLGLQLVQARLAQARGDDPGPWLAAARQVQALPPGLQLQRQVALAMIDPPPHDDLPPLLTLLHARGLRAQQRSAEIAAARAALAGGHRQRALGHARTALSLQAHVDAWIDEPASVWLAAAEVLRAGGQRAEADAAAATGARWVRRGEVQWLTDDERWAWRCGNPVHRQLLAWPADGNG